MQDALRESIEVKQKMLSSPEFWASMARSVEIIEKALRGGYKIMTVGNGGSAADAQHFAHELVGTFRREERRGYPVMALTADATFLTARMNDFGVETTFSRQVEAFGKRGDVLIAISTSGNSLNVIRAAQAAREHGVTSIGLLGSGGGKLKDEVDCAIIVPSNVTARVQEAHTTILHLWCEDIVPRLS